MRIVSWLVGLLAALLGAAATAHADQQSCAEARALILKMEKESVRPPGWVMLDSVLRSQYARDCVLSARRKPEQEYWFRIDGSPTGVKAGCVERTQRDCGERPEEGAYAATPEIGSLCANTTNPSMCAMVKGIEASCLRPIDDRERVQCAEILNGRVADLPQPSERLPPITDLLAPQGANAPRMADAQIWADPGFQRMCKQADDNWRTCTVRRQNMTSIGAPGLGSDGQAGAFYECQRVYQGVLNMCHSTRLAAAAPAKPIVAAPAPKAPQQQPQQQQSGPPGGRSMVPPAPPAPPAQPQMSAKCQKLVGDYVKASEANDGPRALAGYNALKAEGGCNVLDKVDTGAPTASAEPFPTRRGNTLTHQYVDACAADPAGCAQAVRQLEQGTSPEAKAALMMHAISTGLELGAAIASGMAATMPQGGGGGGGTNYNSIGNRRAAPTYGQGSPTPGRGYQPQPTVPCGTGPVCTAR